MVTTSNITDRSGAIDMVDYYCDVTDNLSMLKKILADGGYTGENFSNSIKALSDADVEIVKRNELHTFVSCQNAGLWSVPLRGLINAGGFGKTANVNYRTLSKCFPWPLFAFF